MPLVLRYDDGLCPNDGLLVVRGVHSPFLLRTGRNIFAFNEEDDVTGTTVCSRFDPKLFTGGFTAERDAQFHMCTRL